MRRITILVTIFKQSGIRLLDNVCKTMFPGENTPLPVFSLVLSITSAVKENTNVKAVCLVAL